MQAQGCQYVGRVTIVHAKKCLSKLLVDLFLMQSFLILHSIVLYTTTTKCILPF